MKLEKRHTANRLGGQYFFVSSGRRWFTLWVADRQLIDPHARSLIARELWRFRRLLRASPGKQPTPFANDPRTLPEAQSRLEQF